jgi:tRNA (guanine37-N1)-methyltransferase
VLCAAATKGFDDRVRERVTEELSIGDYVLTGGEAAGAGRPRRRRALRAGSGRDEQSVVEDSFSRGLLDFPQFTRPPRIAAFACPTCCCRAITRRFAAGETGSVEPDARTPAGSASTTQVWTTKNDRCCGNLKERDMGAIELVEKSQLAERPAMKAGDTVKVHVKGARGRQGAHPDLRRRS